MDCRVFVNLSKTNVHLSSGPTVDQRDEIIFPFKLPAIHLLLVS